MSVAFPMDSIDSPQNATRRSLVVGIWSLLVVPLVIVPSEMSVAAAGLALLLISTLNAWGLLLATQSRLGEVINRTTLMLISCGLSLTWSLMLSGRSEPQLLDPFILIATIPIIVVWLTSASLNAIPRTESGRVSNSGIGTGPLQKSVPNETTLSSLKPLHKESSSDLSMKDADEELDSITDESRVEFDKERLSPDVTQWLTRSLTPDGEIVEGGVRVDFVEGQRDATVHVSFCPPLAHSPEIITEDLDGVGLEIKAAASFPFGARLTVRRPVKSSTEAYRVGFHAIATAVRKAG